MSGPMTFGAWDPDDPESDGQQQAAAEEALIRAGRLLNALGVPVDAGVDVIRTTAAALAEVARPGQELRARVEELAADLDAEAASDRLMHSSARSTRRLTATRLRAALEDPR